MRVGPENVDPVMLRDCRTRRGWTVGTNLRSVAELTVVFSIRALRHSGGSAEEARLAIGKAAVNGIENNFLPEPGVFPIA